VKLEMTPERNRARHDVLVRLVEENRSALMGAWAKGLSARRVRALRESIDSALREMRELDAALSPPSPAQRA
jgi:hypothetical protein